jgi:undecaprenyl-diphosphatase
VLRALVLGIVQGLTEFLPISSSAHLSIVPKLLGFRTPELAFEVLLHFGTLAAVVAYFARDLWAFALSVVAPGQLEPGEAGPRRRLLGLLVVASVPAAVAGFLLQGWADAQTARPLRASVWLVLTTAIMIAAELYDRRRSAAASRPAADQGPRAAATRAERHGRHATVRAVRPPAGAVGPGPAADPDVGADASDPATGDPAAGTPAAGAAASPVTANRAQRHGRGDRPAGPDDGAEEELRRLPPATAAGIGLAQAVALIPGTSRSGITISAGLFAGISREAAARFSFLLSIPAILGAGVLKLGDLSSASESGPELLVGFLASAVAGFAAVSFLLRMLRTRTLWPFIWYRIAAGCLFALLLATVRR